MSCCKVTWCNKETEFYNRTQKHSYCKTHYNYKKYASNAASRPWLMYKVEKILDDALECEQCGYDAKTYFPDRPTNELAGLFDVDHIHAKNLIDKNIIDKNLIEQVIALLCLRTNRSWH